MNSQRRLAILFVVFPLVLPLCGFVSLSVIRLVHAADTFMSIQDEYPLFSKPNLVKKLAQKTITILDTVKDHVEYPEVSSKKWIFTFDKSIHDEEALMQKPRFVVRFAQKKKDRPEKVKLADLSAQQETIEDPFLEEWLIEQKKEDVNDISKASANSLFAGLAMGVQKKIPTSSWDGFATVDQAQRSEGADKPLYVIEDGNVRPVSVLNYIESENRYLSYANIEGKVFTNDIAWESMFLQVSFFDQLGEDGFESEYATALASQQIHDGSGLFSLRLPAETQGYLLAKVFSKLDSKMTKPLFVGAMDSNPLVVPSQGVKGLYLSVIATAEYLDKHETSFLGKIVDAKGEAIVGADVWVAETQAHTKTNQLGVFELRGLLKGLAYHFIFDKQDFIPVQKLAMQDSKNKSQTFKLPLESTFTQGYDLFLGARDPQRSFLFAKIFKQGKAVQKAIIKTTSDADVIYERELELMSIPDRTLFSTQENGKFILWNAAIGKSKIEVYLDGKKAVSRTVKLSPGVIHYLNIELP